MKKKIFSIVGVAVFAVVVAFNINAVLRNDGKGDVTLANVEVMAQGEVDLGDPWPSTATSTSLWCNGRYVIRCVYGSGNCDPSWQDLC